MPLRTDYNSYSYVEHKASLSVEFLRVQLKEKYRIVRVHRMRVQWARITIGKKRKCRYTKCARAAVREWIQISFESAHEVTQ